MSALDALNALTLDEVRAELTRERGALEVIVRERTNKIRSLEALEKMLDLRENGPKKRAPRGSKKNAGKPSSSEPQTTDDPSVVTNAEKLKDPVALRVNVIDAIDQHGPMTVGEISHKIGVVYHRVDNVLKTGPFRRDAEKRYHLK